MSARRGVSGDKRRSLKGTEMSAGGFRKGI